MTIIGAVILIWINDHLAILSPIKWGRIARVVFWSVG